MSSTNTQRVLIVQDASRELCVLSVRHVLSGFSLRRGDKIRLLGIIQAFTKKDTFCVSLLSKKLFSALYVKIFYFFSRIVDYLLDDAPA